ncbi:hypothetical protein VZT92_017584 [Zoarces viviparus]|uniref:Envelope glycoprotein n=1 Tax=Zoarces viviparus TaxID=48416 RepID=A0AAW1END4_ZOAVI
MRITILMQKKREEKRAQCNWIYPENGIPGWYCSWACVPWAEQGTKGYWKPEVTYAASHRNDTCLTIMPGEGMFWGHYNFTCEATPPRRKTRRQKVKPPGNPTTGQRYNITSRAEKDTQREEKEEVRPTVQEAKEWQAPPVFKPHYLADGASPRCTLWQEWRQVWGTWQYDCTGLKENRTIKGTLQAWKETHTRDDSSTWWGLQKNEVLDWVVPCLTQTTNYWVKYQYIATVYSKDRDIWPGEWSKPEPYVGPQPWKMECDRGNTTCNISLAGRHCETVPGWTDHCQRHYGHEYETHVQEVTWKKGQDKKWRRTGPTTSSCTNLILGHRMKNRENVNGQIIPPVTDPIVFLAEGHAFRKSLCEGKEDKGFEWVGPNRLYGNGTCYSPEEHWLSCGSGRREHECSWIELTGASIVGTATIVVEEVAGKIGEGVTIVKGWMGTLFSWLWPYLLMIVGTVILSIITCAAIKGGVAATAASCFKRNPKKKREVEERPLLRTREGHTHL